MAGKMDVEALLQAGETVQFPTTGWSMYPLVVQDRDQVIVAPARPEELHRGDVALYRRPGSILVLHRVWKATPQGFYLVGDNQTEIEGPLAPAQIRGKLVAVVRKGREIPVTAPVYRLCSGLWLLLRPFRRAIAVPVAAVKRALRRLLRRGKS